MFERHATIALAAYHDLLDPLQDGAVSDNPDELREAYEDVLSRGPKWRERIAASLKRMPDTGERPAPLQTPLATSDAGRKISQADEPEPPMLKPL